MRRRTGGETVPDAQVVAEHSDLMPELLEELHKVALIESAVNRAQSSDNSPSAQTVHRAVANAASPPVFALPGYEIVEEIHRGGQGVVYRAVQQATRRDVAIKVMHEGPFAGRRDRLRFEREVQILAQLRHANIVTIHDSGTTRGHFYYVMDYIPGQALDEWAAAGQARSNDRTPERSIDDLLRLFAGICEAVNAAHLLGVIHRDLKPGNIRIDEHGEPHVLDFGLAKFRTDESIGRTGTGSMTATGQFVGSMPWASPEQVEGSPDRVDIRTDVYSLGVILYQLLTGRFPYSITGNIREVLGNILETEPAKPRSFRRDIDDEVETIVLKCLAKERERRYQTAGDLARDVRRYLKGDPIEAKRNSTLYMLKKAARRYRVPLAAACSLFVVIAAALVVSLTFWRQSEARAESLRREGYTHRIALADAAYDANLIDRMNHLLGECPVDLRGWDWYRLKYASDRSLLTLDGPDGPLSAVAMSPNGRRIAAAVGDMQQRFDEQPRDVFVWDTESGRRLLRLRGHTKGICCFAFSPDGGRLASGSMDTTLRVWNAESGEILKTITGHGDAIYDVAFSPDGATIVTAARDPDHTVRAWDAATAEPLWVYRGYANGVMGVSFASDGKRIATCSYDGTAKALDVASGRELCSFSGHGMPVLDVAFAPDGEQVATCGQDKTIKVWDAVSGKESLTLRGHQDYVTSVNFSRDGRQIVSGSRDATIRLWDANAGSALATLRGHQDLVQDVAISPDGRCIVSGSADRTVKVWDAVCCGDVFTISEVNDWQRRSRLMHIGNSAVSSPDGKQIASIGYARVPSVWNASTGEQIIPVAWHDDQAVMQLAYAADGRHVVTIGWNDTIKVWDTLTGECEKTLPAGTSRNLTIACSPDGRRIASAGGDNKIRVWDLAAGRPVCVLSGHEDSIVSIAFCPHGRDVLSGSLDKTVRRWNPDTGREVAVLAARDAPILAVALSPDGRRFASSDAEGSVSLQDAITGSTTWSQRAHRFQIQALAFSPDGQRLVSGAAAGLLKVWDANGGELLLTLRGHEAAINSVAFGPDGRSILSASEDGTLRLWETGPPPEGLESRRIVILAARIVESRFLEYANPDDVIRSLQTDPTLSGPVQTAALRMARTRWQRAEYLANRSWEVISDAACSKRGLPWVAWERALNASLLAPMNGRILSVCGAAKYRIGYYDQSIDTLTQAESVNGALPADLAFLAMAHHRLGDSEHARSELGRLQELMEDPRYAQDETSRKLLHEAEQTILGS